VATSGNSAPSGPEGQVCSIDELCLANEQMRQEIASLREIEQQVTALNCEVEGTQREIIFRLAEIVEARSRETGGHVMRVAELSRLLALKCGLADGQAELLGASAPMHDVGKVGIPDAILFNPGRLSSEEFEVMKTHTTIGYDMLAGSSRSILKHAAVIALQHHEKFNGTGYPLGLRGGQIHPFGRIVAIADVFDALSSDRVYRKAWDMDRIIAYFKRQRGESFDPDLLDLFFEHLDDFQAVRHALPETRPKAQSTDAPDTSPDRRRILAQLADMTDGATEIPPAANAGPQAFTAGPSSPCDVREGQPIMRILVADDDLVSRNVLETTLDRWGYDVVVCEDVDEIDLAMRDKVPPKLAIVSHSLRDSSGLDVCRMIRRRDGTYVYIILLAEADHSGQTAQGMSAGADACIHKPLGENELSARLTAAERIINLQDQLLRSQATLQEQASHDALTGLWNRRAILTMLRSELDRARREDISVAVIMTDLDRFKVINDTFGHQAGDIALREASRRMRNVTRPYDMVGRYGGEEFIIIVPRCDSTFASHVAERVRCAVGAKPVTIDGHDHPLTLSLGVAAVRGIEDTGTDALVRAADDALYRAKHEGRNCVRIAEVVLPNA